MKVWSPYNLGPCTDVWLLANLISSMYLDAFLAAFRVFNVTTLFFFNVGFELLLLEFRGELG